MEGYLKKDNILTVQDLPFEDVEVPEWKGKVRIRTLTGEEIDAYHSSMFEIKGRELIQRRENFRAKLLIRCIVDEKGERVFADDDLKSLSKKSGLVINRLYNVASRLNALEEGVEAVLEKN
jgi:hypothetical protein